MASSRYIVGIDLGTTHTALAYAELADTSAFPRIRILDIPQTIKPGWVERRVLLPSSVYLPAENELPEGSLALPWDRHAPRTDKGAQYVVGEFARTRGAEVPGRLISSAKSWLSQPGAKRRSAMLPWGPETDAAGVSKLSPVEASSLILRHLASAWDDSLGRDPKHGLLKDQRIVLCVPASFDAVARELTLEAAKRAGLPNATLLEEPQAAFYAWIAHSRDTWREQLHTGDLVLIVDIGGGTTDFTLIAAEDDNGALALRRIAVGDHILLGGDNMDLALARSAAERLAARGVKLDAWQMRGLALACRDAKEKLLEGTSGTASSMPKKPEPIVPLTARKTIPNATLQADSVPCLYIRKKPKKSLRKSAADSVPLPVIPAEPAADPAPVRRDVPLPILGRGGDVIGKSIKAALSQTEAECVTLDGFFDSCAATARPIKAGRSGLREMGLAFAADTSVTKHLAQFLAGAHALPTAIVFNGGVMKSALLRERITSVVSNWIGSQGGVAPRVLSGIDPELAVARGAAYFGRVQAARGVRIRGGVPRSYYIGVEAPQPALPGQTPFVKALCVVPFGMDEGTELDVPDSEFGLTVGEPARFLFFSANERPDDRIGERVEIRQDALRELDAIETTIAPTLFDAAGTSVFVRLKSVLTAVGTLELWFHEIGGAGAWKLELNVRE